MGVIVANIENDDPLLYTKWYGEIHGTGKPPCNFTLIELQPGGSSYEVVATSGKLKGKKYSVDKSWLCAYKALPMQVGTQLVSGSTRIEIVCTKVPGSPKHFRYATIEPVEYFGTDGALTYANMSNWDIPHELSLSITEKEI